MIRDLCAVVGALSLLTGACVVIWAIAVECSARSDARRRHDCAAHETLDADTAYLTWRCVICACRRPAGIAWFIGSNRRARREA